MPAIISECGKEELINKGKVRSEREAAGHLIRMVNEKQTRISASSRQMEGILGHGICSSSD